MPGCVRPGHCGGLCEWDQEREHLKMKQLQQEWSRLGRNTIAAIKLHFELLLALMISFFLSKVYHSFPDLKSTS